MVNDVSMQHSVARKANIHNSLSHQQLIKQNSSSPTSPSWVTSTGTEEFSFPSTPKSPSISTNGLEPPTASSTHRFFPPNSTKPRPNSLNLRHSKHSLRQRLQNHNNNYQEQAQQRRRSAETAFSAASTTTSPTTAFNATTNMGYVVEPRFNPVTNDGSQQNGSQSYHRQPDQSPGWSPTGIGGQTPTDPKTATTTTASPPDLRGDFVVGGADVEGAGHDVGDGTINQNTLLNYESVVVLNNTNHNNNNTFPSSTLRGPPNHQMTVTSIDSTTPAGKVRKMKKDAKRLVYKDGNCNVSHCNIQERRRKYLADLFTTLIDIRWRWSFFIFFSSFVCSWTFFAVIWYVICWLHKDLENIGVEGWKPCVVDIHSFTSAFLFSLETQHTIGYGSRSTTEECPEAVVIMMIQSALGVMIQAFMVGVIYAKLARPKKRAQTLVFSKNAVICMRNGKYCLLFRVGDVRRSHLVEAHVRVMVIRKKVTSEGEILPMYQYDVNVGYDDGCDRIFLVWPITICHEIDEDSPFWKITPEDLFKDDFELVVILEGIVETTGMSTQVRTSYLPSEIYWGRCFERLVHYQEGVFKVDYSRFHYTIPIPDMPRISPKQWEELNGSDSSSSTSSSSSSEGSDKTKSGAVLIDIPDSELNINISQNPHLRDVTQEQQQQPSQQQPMETTVPNPTSLSTIVNPIQHFTQSATPNGHIGSLVPHTNSKLHQRQQQQLQQPSQFSQPPSKSGVNKAGSELRGAATANTKDVCLSMETGI